MIFALALTAFAGDHDGAPPGGFGSGVRAVPSGPPVVVTVEPGEPVDALVATLPAGSTVRLRAGRHAGPIWLDRPIELLGEPGAVVDGGGLGTVIVATSSDVSVHDLRITGGGFLPQQDDSGIVFAGDHFSAENLVVDHAYLGIDVRRVGDGVVRNCQVRGEPGSPFGLRGDGIRLWEANHVVVEGNTLADVRDLVVWYSTEITLRSNEVRDSRYGTHLMHSDNVEVVDNRYEDDVVGVFVMYTDEIFVHGNVMVGAAGEAGIGIGLKESDRIRVEGNDIVSNTTAIYLDTTPQRVGGTALFSGNLIGANHVGVRLHGKSRGAEFVGNHFVANAQPATTDSRVGDEFVSFVGNTWDDYAGYDLDGDGAGDLAYEARSVSGALVERRPELAWFDGTPAASLLEMFAAAFPMFAPRPIVTDPRPSMRAP